MREKRRGRIFVAAGGRGRVLVCMGEVGGCWDICQALGILVGEMFFFFFCEGYLVMLFKEGGVCWGG